MSDVPWGITSNGIVPALHAGSSATVHAITTLEWQTYCGELAQTVERPLSMREVPGSMPEFSSSTI